MRSNHCYLFLLGFVGMGATHAACARSGFGSWGETCGPAQGCGFGSWGVDNGTSNYPGATLGCPEAVVWSDDFEDGVLGAEWTSPDTSRHGAIEESGGNLVLTVSGGSGSAFLLSRHPQWLADSSVQAEVTQIVPADAGIESSFGVEYENLDKLELHQEGGELRFERRREGNWASLASVPYDPQGQRFWRLRHGPGKVSFETSPDGLRFTAHLETPWQQETGRIYVYTWNEGGQAQPSAFLLGDIETVLCAD